MHLPSTDQVTNGVAVGAISSPVWLPSLADISQTFAMLTPILGGIWLLVQIGGFFYRREK